MKIYVNEEPKEVPAGSTVADLVRDSGLPPKHLAVECNGRLVVREEHVTCRLEEGDRLEVVTLVGGG